MQKDIRAVVFDAYGTLFDVHSVVAECEACCPGKGYRLSRLWRSKQLEYTWLRSLMGRYCDFEQVTRDALRAALMAQGERLSDASEGRLMDAYLALDPFNDVTGLSRLEERRRAILTNGTPRMIDAVVRRAGLASLFAAVISVDEVRIFKPHPSVYALVPQRLGVEPAQVGFVSSNFWDVCGAASFGFNAFWLNRAGMSGDELGFTPAAILRSLDELPAALAA